MAIKDHIKWILTRSHFWIVVSIYSIINLIRDYRIYGHFNPFISSGTIIGTFIFVFIIYAILKTIHVFASRRKKE